MHRPIGRQRVNKRKEEQMRKEKIEKNSEQQKKVLKI